MEDQTRDPFPASLLFRQTDDEKLTRRSSPIDLLDGALTTRANAATTGPCVHTPLYRFDDSRR